MKGLGWPKYRFGIFFCWAGWMENLRRMHDLQTARPRQPLTTAGRRDMAGGAFPLRGAAQ